MKPQEPGAKWTCVWTLNTHLNNPIVVGASGSHL
jgi:hypothetical protein